MLVKSATARFYPGHAHNSEWVSGGITTLRSREIILTGIEDGIRSSMKGRQIAGILVGAFIAFLGPLWFLQGTGILRMHPILCVANCEEIVGGSPFWAVVGAIAFIIGVIVVVVSGRRIETPCNSKRIKLPSCNSNPSFKNKGLRHVPSQLLTGNSSRRACS